MISERQLKKKLKAVIIGQDAAIDALARAVTIASIGICDPVRPLGTFLFLGPTGVGKSQIGRELATILHGSEQHPGLVIVNCTEFKSPHDVARLTGAPPGYLGADQPPFITPEKLSDPFSIVIFEEIEKADRALYDLLLQILDRGELTTGMGRLINFRNCFIILTSNLGTQEINKLARGAEVGFNTAMVKFLDLAPAKAAEKIKGVTTKVLENFFSPEFLNRLDELITFNTLSTPDLTAILDKLLGETRSRIAVKGAMVSVSANAKRFLLRKGTNQLYGARPLRRAIRLYLEYPVASFVSENLLESNNRLEVDVKDWEKDEALTVTAVSQEEILAAAEKAAGLGLLPKPVSASAPPRLMKKKTSNGNGTGAE